VSGVTTQASLAGQPTAHNIVRIRTGEKEMVVNERHDCEPKALASGCTSLNRCVEEPTASRPSLRDGARGSEELIRLR
jgi:hypothetical protein